MLAILAVHGVAAVLAPALVRALGRRAFWVLAFAPLSGLVWTLTQTSTARNGGAATQTVSWIPSLQFDLAFRLDALSWLLAVLVTGIGALVLFYCRWYFKSTSKSVGQFAGVLTAFAGAMFGIVVSDDMLLMFTFWELTTILSYLLIGQDAERKTARRAAMQALVVTTFGGLVMLIGLIMLGQQVGSYRISDVVTARPDDTWSAVAIALVLVGALSKSALVPLHFWLPGAMAAPTPVSAYLHAAAMVKAGIFLVARFAPAFHETVAWQPMLLGLGSLTMLIGGWQALRQQDLKLLLAHGTVSQLGFLMILVGAGTPTAATAGLALLVAHALFKATLFLTVGAIDRHTGTRDLTVLSGLWRARPVLFAAAALAAASMAGLPPLIGFAAKEAALTSFLDNGGVNGSLSDGATLAAIALGSVLTVAYSARFLWGAFGGKTGVPPTAITATPPGFVAVPALLAFTGLAIGVAPHPLDNMIAPYASTLGPGAEHLALWHGFTPALGLTVLIVAAGAGLFAARAIVARVQGLFPGRPIAEQTYRATMRGVDRVAVEVTGATQRGSQPLFLGTILVTLVVVVGTAVAKADAWPDHVDWVHRPAEVVVGAITVLGAVLAARSLRRLRAVLLVGVTGYGTAMLFLLGGAPDLALTQVLVETITLVVFALVLRRLPPRFSERPLPASRWIRLAIALAVGATISVVALLATAARSQPPVSAQFADEAVAYGGGKNIVNVTIVDIRAWDTMGEISVLLVAATGVASLTFIRRRNADLERTSTATRAAATKRNAAGRGRQRWLAAGPLLDPDRRSVILEVFTRLVFHSVLMFSLYLLFSGHNLPGGGFAAGLVAGLALTIRYLAGGRHELTEAIPVDAGVVIGMGLFVATGAGLAPFLFGGEVLRSAIIDLHLPVFGDVHLVTSVFFDVGVFLVVVGLILDILRSLGAEIDRQIEDGDTDSDSDQRRDSLGGATTGPAPAPIPAPADTGSSR